MCASELVRKMLALHLTLSNECLSALPASPHARQPNRDICRNKLSSCSSQAEVLVCAWGGGLLKERKALAALLLTFKLRLQRVD